MSDTKTLHELFVDELRDSYDSEKQLVKALRKLARSAQHPELQAAFSGHLDETEGQIKVLEEVFELLELKPRGKHCDGTAGIVEEGNSAIEDISKSAVRDSALVGGARRAEHYEIAAYNGLIGMATELGYKDAVPRFQRILAQEEAADRKLASLAKAINKAANVESKQAA